MTADKAARSLMRVMTHLIKHDEDMPLTRAQVFLLIATRDGILVKDIVKRTGMNQSSIARSLGHLGDRPPRGLKEGLLWVEGRIDPVDPRRATWHLTPKGQQVLAEITDLMD